MLPDGSTIDSGFGANFEHHDHETETMRTPYVRCKTSASFTFDIDGLAERPDLRHMPMVPDGQA
jgi:hypothetical protein